jgi:hypothetical protein
MPAPLTRQDSKFDFHEVLYTDLYTDCQLGLEITLKQIGLLT